MGPYMAFPLVVYTQRIVAHSRVQPCLSYIRRTCAIECNSYGQFLLVMSVNGFRIRNFEKFFYTHTYIHTHTHNNVANPCIAMPHSAIVTASVHTNCLLLSSYEYVYSVLCRYVLLSPYYYRTVSHDRTTKISEFGSMALRL
jgi:hypothetical protein